jgi:PBSX family phage terminase large subunit
VPIAVIPGTVRPTAAQRAYVPRGAALALFYDRSPEVVLEGPAGTGKSRGLLEKAHLCAEKYAGCRILLVRKTRESMTESVLVTFEEKVLPEGHPAGFGPLRRNRQAYDYPNGSTIVVAGLIASGKDQRAKVMSTEYDMILVFEATELSEHEYEQLTSRLRNGVMPYQQILADCNPDAPTHWLHQRCDAGAAAVHFSRHEDNPVLHDGTDWTAAGRAYLGVLDRLTGARRERLRFGRRAAAEGLVYDGFDHRVHLLPADFPILPEWSRVRVIDFGFTNPFVCLWFALDGDGRAYRYREIYMTQRTVAEHMATIQRVERWFLEDGSVNPDRERIVSSIADHDAEDRQTLARGGIGTIPAYKAVGRGIQAVQARLAVAGDGKPRLFFLRDALIERDQKLVDAKKPWCTEQEFDGYRWPQGQDGKPLKEEPIKEHDHGMDAVRYLCAQLDLRGSLGGGLVR